METTKPWTLDAMLSFFFGFFFSVSFVFVCLSIPLAQKLVVAALEFRVFEFGFFFGFSLGFWEEGSAGFGDVFWGGGRGVREGRVSGAGCGWVFFWGVSFFLGGLLVEVEGFFWLRRVWVFLFFFGREECFFGVQNERRDK